MASPGSDTVEVHARSGPSHRRGWPRMRFVDFRIVPSWFLRVNWFFRTGTSKRLPCLKG